MYRLPKSVNVCGVDHPIRDGGDYRMILDCFVALDDASLSEKERILSSVAIFYDEIQAIEDIFVLFDTEEKLKEAVIEMYHFFNAGEQSTGLHSNVKLVDWEQDEKLICAAVNAVAKCEIRLESYMHWWTFLSYYMSVGDSALSTVICIRDKIAHGKKLEKWEQDFKKNNPQHFKWKKKTVEQQEAEDMFKEVWNKS